MFSKKLKGYALPFAVFVSVIVVILSSSLILATHYNNRFYNRIIMQDRLNTNVSSAMNLLLVHPDMVENDGEKLLSLYGETADSVKVEKESWGIFDSVLQNIPAHFSDAAASVFVHESSLELR